MKKGRVFGKRMVVLAVLIISLSAAVYLNWRYSNLDGSLNLTAALTGTNKYLGDAQYVNQQSTSSKVETNFFVKSRQDRDKTRKDSVATLKSIVDDVKASDSAKAEATKQITVLVKNSEAEAALETLIKAKKFSDCIAIISDDQVSIVVKTGQNGLLPSETMQIQDIVTTSTKKSVENIKIIEVK